MDGASDGRNRPSSEWRLHRVILAARAEVGAVVHAHSVFATTLACLGRGIPAFHYMIAVVGGRDTRARKLGLPGNESLEAVIGEYLDDFGVG